MFHVRSEASPRKEKLIVKNRPKNWILSIVETCEPFFPIGISWPRTFFPRNSPLYNEWDGIRKFLRPMRLWKVFQIIFRLPIWGITILTLPNDPPMLRNHQCESRKTAVANLYVVIANTKWMLSTQFLLCVVNLSTRK